MTSPQAESQARRFWRMVENRPNISESFPRDLEAAIAWAVPASVFLIPNLDTQLLRDWLHTYRIGIPMLCKNRRLRGCLVAACAEGAIFLDALDSTDEQRYTLAHELAHFLLGYYWPRERAIKAMGERIISVLDGERPPTPSERMNAILKGVPLGTMNHLMDRGPGLRIRSDRVLRIEDDADALAIEIIAPRQRVLQAVERRVRSWRQPEAEAETQQILEQQFGLPQKTAANYATQIVGGQHARSSFRDWLGSGPCTT